MEKKKKYKRSTDLELEPQPMSKIEIKEQMILKSKMPLNQKNALLKQIGVLKEEAEKGVPFNVYSRIKNIKSGLQEAMLVFPKAKGVRLATIEAWDSIFKDF